MLTAYERERLEYLANLPAPVEDPDAPPVDLTVIARAILDLDQRLACRIEASA